MIHFSVQTLVAYTARGAYEIVFDPQAKGYDVYFQPRMRGWPNSNRVRLSCDGDEWPDLASAMAECTRHDSLFPQVIESDFVPSAKQMAGG